MSVRALSVEPNFKVENNCSILQEYNITNSNSNEQQPEEEGAEKIIDGKCTEKKFQEAYQK